METPKATYVCCRLLVTPVFAVIMDGITEDTVQIETPLVIEHTAGWEKALAEGIATDAAVFKVMQP